MTTLMSPFGRHSQENWYFAYERDLPHLFCHAAAAAAAAETFMNNFDVVPGFGHLLCGDSEREYI